MIYLIMCGRLGNQLFQYSFARKIQEETGQELAIDFTAINNVHKEDWINYLEKYNVNSYTIVEKDQYYPIQRFVYKMLKFLRPKSNEKRKFVFDEISSKLFSRFGVIFYESDYKYHEFKNIKAKNIVIRGWFESELYFSEISNKLQNELIPKILPDNVQNLANRLRENHCVCLTVRRGNFTDENLKDEFLICTREYYKKAVEYIRKIYPESILYICSDDIEWCKDAFKFEGEVIFEQEKDVTLKLYLMSQCTDFILSNSTFSWWAQYLSFRKNKIVIAPHIWRRTELPPEAIFSSKWLLFDELGNEV